jgi:hypothetical protein
VQVFDPPHGSPEDGAIAGQGLSVGGPVCGGFVMGSLSPHASVAATTMNEGAKSFALDCLPLIPQ